jgi:hypothetical protein
VLAENYLSKNLSFRLASDIVITYIQVIGDRRGKTGNPMQTVSETASAWRAIVPGAAWSVGKSPTLMSASETMLFIFHAEYPDGNTDEIACDDIETAGALAREAADELDALTWVSVRIDDVGAR